MKGGHSRALLLSALLAAGCSGGTASGVEGQSIDACKAKVEERTGQTFEEADPPWRITSRAEGRGYVVNVWTETAAGAQRPTGSPEHVCVTQRGRDADDVRVVELRP